MVVSPPFSCRLRSKQRSHSPQTFESVVVFPCSWFLHKQAVQPCAGQPLGLPQSHSPSVQGEAGTTRLLKSFQGLVFFPAFLQGSAGPDTACQNAIVTHSSAAFPRPRIIYCTELRWALPAQGILHPFPYKSWVHSLPGATHGRTTPQISVCAL